MSGPFGQRCGTCSNFNVPKGEDQGICRAHAPQVSVYVLPQKSVMGQTQLMPIATANFPMVDADLCWCGEWATKIALN